MRRSRIAALAGLALLPVLGSGFLLQSRTERESVQLLQQVLSLVSSRFVDTLDTGQLYEKAARGLVQELNDPYSELLTPKDLKAFTQTTGGRYGGIGMQIEDQQGQITISTVFPNTPAEENGLRVGDRIIQVDTMPVRGWTTAKVSEAITGEPGTRVSVRFSRPGVAEPIALTFTRAVIHIPAVPYAIMMDGRTGYVPLQRFNETAAEEVAQSIRALQQRGARGIVLDMRGNPGGILEQSLAISNLFLERGAEIASVRGRGGDQQEYRARSSPLLPDMPLIVLIDQYSASASEIVAGALQDHDRALVLGETTFGKGLVQSVFNLDGGYALKLTTAKWFTPSGRSIQRERTVVNGRFVAEAHPSEAGPADTATAPELSTERPSSAETEASKKARPAFRSKSGRVVYGGGGVAPDIIIKEDTLTTAEQTLSRALARKTQDVYVVLSDYTLELSRSVNKDFAVSPEWREEFLRRLRAKGVEVDDAQWKAGTRYVDRLLEQRVARNVAGDSTAKRRDLKFDAPLRRAIDLMNRGQTQRDLFTIAAAQRGRTAAAPSSTPAPGRP